MVMRAMAVLIMLRLGGSTYTNETSLDNLLRDLGPKYFPLPNKDCQTMNLTPDASGNLSVQIYRDKCEKHVYHCISFCQTRSELLKSRNHDTIAIGSEEY